MVGVPGILIFDVLNGATALNATNSEASGIRKAADDSGLPLERALQGLVELCRVLEVDDVDVAICGADDAQVILHVEAVDALLALHRRSRPLLAHIPVLDRLVPRARHHHGRAVVVEEAHVAHRLVVRSYHNVLLRGEVAYLDVLVGARRDDFGSILLS